MHVAFSLINFKIALDTLGVFLPSQSVKILQTLTDMESYYCVIVFWS